MSKFLCIGKRAYNLDHIIYIKFFRECLQITTTKHEITQEFYGKEAIDGWDEFVRLINDRN